MNLVTPSRIVNESTPPVINLPLLPDKHWTVQPLKTLHRTITNIPRKISFALFEALALYERPDGA